MSFGALNTLLKATRARLSNKVIPFIISFGRHPEAKKQFIAHILRRTQEQRGNTESLFLLGKKIKPAKIFFSFDGHFLRVTVFLPAAGVGDTEI